MFTRLSEHLRPLEEALIASGHLPAIGLRWLGHRPPAAATRDRDIDQYYAGRTDADRDEERAWGELGAEALAVSSQESEK